MVQMSFPARIDEIGGPAFRPSSVSQSDSGTRKYVCPVG